jgi:hypothetical protein
MSCKTEFLSKYKILIHIIILQYRWCFFICEKLIEMQIGSLYKANPRIKI